MANTKISELSAASALSGTEQIPGVQSAANVKITPEQIKTYVQDGTLMDEIDIGEWDIDASPVKNVAHGLDWTKIISITGYIINDANTFRFTIPTFNVTASDAVRVSSYDSTNITLRAEGASFESANFNATAASPESLGSGANRGKLFVVYTT